MSAWKMVAHFMIPVPVVMCIALVTPAPAVVKKGLLQLAKKVLFLEVIGGWKLVHVMMLVTATVLSMCAHTTYRLGNELVDDRLTPNQRMGLHAKKWREERNFWMALLAFLLWAMLNRFYVLMLDYTVLQDEAKRLKLQVARLQQQAGVPAKDPQMASAPPAGAVAGEHTGSGQRSKKAA